MKSGTPSLKRSANTFALWLRGKSRGVTRGYAEEADETERLQALRARRGVTVVGDQESKISRRAFLRGRVWLDVKVHASPESSENLSNRGREESSSCEKEREE